MLRAGSACPEEEEEDTCVGSHMTQMYPPPPQTYIQRMYPPPPHMAYIKRMYHPPPYMIYIQRMYPPPHMTYIWFRISQYTRSICIFFAFFPSCILEYYALK